MIITRPQELEPILQSIGYKSISPLFIGVHCSADEFAQFFRKASLTPVKERKVAAQYDISQERTRVHNASSDPDEIRNTALVPDVLQGIELLLVRNFSAIHYHLRKMPIEGVVYVGNQGLAAWYHAPLAQTDFSGDLRETGKIGSFDFGTFVVEYIDRPEDHLVMHYTKPVDHTKLGAKE